MRDEAQLGAILSTAKHLYVSGGAGDIPDLSALLRRHGTRDATVTGIFSPLVNRLSYADREHGVRVRTFFMNATLREHLAEGLVDYCPWRYGVADAYLSAPGRFDTALVMLSPPDADGICSLGVQADFFPSFRDRVPRIVGFINPRMPRTAGDTAVRYDALAAAVDCDVPLRTATGRAPDPALAAIAAHITPFVPDGATLQLGIGQIPSQVLARLGDRRALRVHSGIVDDHVLGLQASGALDPDAPIVTGMAIGTPALYDAVADAARFRFRAVAHTHAFATLARIPRFIAVNSVLQVDLLGQMSAEGSGAGLVATPGGLPDFARGALASDGGRAIIAVRARAPAGHPAGIVPLLGASTPVTLGAIDADVVVTEFGAASIRHLALDERAAALIAIAAPEDRASLAAQWSEVRASLLGRTRDAARPPAAARG